MVPELSTQYPELKRLARRIRRSKAEFSLFFVECNLPTLRQELANSLSEQLETPAIQVTLPVLSEHLIQFDQLIAEHIKNEPLESSVFLFGLENWLPTLSQETLHQTVQQLNWRRSAFSRLRRPLVIWLPKYALDLLAEHTPDFYDWYSGVFVFKAEKHAQNLEIKESLRQLNSNSEVANAADYLDYEDARRWLHTLNSLLSESKELDMSHIRLLNEVAFLYKKLGDPEKAEEFIEKSLVIVRASGDRSNEATVLNNIGQVLISKGEISKALMYLERALIIWKELDNKPAIGLGLNNVAQAYQKMGHTEAALRYLNESLHIAIETGNRATEAGVLGNIATIHHLKEDYDLALELLNKSLKIDTEVGDRLGEGGALNNISLIYKAKGDYQKSLKYMERSLKLQHEMGNKSEEGIVINNMAMLAFEQKDYDVALKMFKKSLKITQEVGDRFGESNALSNIAQAYGEMGDFETELKCLKQSLVIKQEIEDKFGEPVIIASIGTAHWEIGDKDVAFKFWLQGYGLAKKVGNYRALKSFETITSLFNPDEMKDWEARAEKVSTKSIPN